MIDPLRKHVQAIFAPYRHVKAARDLEEELLLHLGEKLLDYKRQGYSDEEAYKWTVDSIGDKAELMEAMDPEYSKVKDHSGVFSSVELGVFRWFSNGITAAFGYAILFVALMLAFNGTITRDGITLPAVAILLVISLIQYLVKGDSKHPRWLVLGSFVVPIVVAVAMTVILH